MVSSARALVYHRYGIYIDTYIYTIYIGIYICSQRQHTRLRPCMQPLAAYTSMRPLVLAHSLPVLRPCSWACLSQCAERCLAQCRRSLASQRSLRLFTRALSALLRQAHSLGRASAALIQSLRVRLGTANRPTEHGSSSGTFRDCDTDDAATWHFSR